MKISSIKRCLALLVAIFLMLSSYSQSKDDKDSKRPPNIVFILADDLGWKDLACYGSQYYQTPNIDRFAAEGMTFTSAYMMPTCAPSRAALMSGQYPPRTDIYSVDAFGRTPLKLKQLNGIKSEKEMNTEVVTIAERLKNNGYVTGHFGKWHLGDTKETLPEGQGFDFNLAGGSAGRPDSYFYPYGNVNCVDGNKDDYLSDQVTNGACDFMRANTDQAFFLYLPFYLVHVPLHTKQEWVNKYKVKAGCGLQNVPEYGAMVSYMDYCVGKVLATIKDLGLQNNTLVIFTSDNGGQNMVTSNSPLSGQKGNLSEGGIRVPLIVRWPGVIKPRTTSDVPVTVVDFYPTLLDVSGISANKDQVMDGESLVSLFKGSQKLTRDAIFWHLPNYNGNGVSNAELWQTPGGAVRLGDWKLIENFENGAVQLYNLKTDISERINLAEKFPKKRDELLDHLKKWRQSCDAPIPNVSNPTYTKDLVPKVEMYENKRNRKEMEKLILIK